MATAARCLEENDRLVMNAQQGDPEAFGALYVQHRPEIYAVCLRFCRDESLAEDMVQEAFISALQNIKHFQFRAKFSTWLYRIAVNVCLMEIRRPNRKPELCDPLEIMKSEDGEIYDIPQLKEIPHCDEDIDSNALRNVITDAICELQPIYRTVFVPKYVEDLRFKEVAEATNCSVQACKTRAMRARFRLKIRLRSLNPKR